MSLDATGVCLKVEIEMGSIPFRFPVTAPVWVSNELAGRAVAVEEMGGARSPMAVCGRLDPGPTLLEKELPDVFSEDRYCVVFV